MQDSLKLILFLLDVACDMFFCQMMRYISKVLQRCFFSLHSWIYSFSKTERRRIPCWQNRIALFAMFAHAFKQSKYLLVLKQLWQLFLKLLEDAHNSKVQVPAKERAHLRKVGSSTKSTLSSPHDSNYWKLAPTMASRIYQNKQLSMTIRT